MIGKDGDAWTCAEHPELSTDEEGAAAHLRDEHPDLWQRLGAIEIQPVRTRAERRRAERELAAHERARKAASPVAPLTLTLPPPAHECDDWHDGRCSRGCDNEPLSAVLRRTDELVDHGAPVCTVCGATGGIATVDGSCGVCWGVRRGR